MATDPIVLVGDLESYQGGDAQSLIDQATALVRRYCGWHVTPERTETMALDGSGGRSLRIPSLHVTGVSAVTNDGTAYTDDDFAWSSVGTLTRGPRTGIWAEGPRKVRATVTHGYSPDDAADLASVIMARATRMQASPGSASRVQAGPFSEQYESGSGFTSDEMATLDRYRLPPRP